MSIHLSGRDEAPLHKRVWIWVTAALAISGVFAVWFFLPLKSWTDALQHWLEALGVWGFAAFGAVYALATILLAPASALSVAAGLFFGFWGIPLVVAAATIGACTAFLISRYVVRQKVREAIERRPKFAAIDQAVKEEGWKVVALLRLSPAVPFNIQNYLFGITEIEFLPYAIATFTGIIPGVVFYVYLGVLGKEASSGSGSGTLKWTFFGVGLVATLAVAVIITRRAKQKLKETGVSQES
jgi:uncharacterized membrane protein YdjX (TVP38/TMEM64 family)